LGFGSSSLRYEWNWDQLLIFALVGVLEDWEINVYMLLNRSLPTPTVASEISLDLGGVGSIARSLEIVTFCTS